MSAKQFQNSAFELLKQSFGENQARREFPIGQNANDIFADNGRYRPRLDLAVGPFNIDPDREANTLKILHSANQLIVQKIIEIANAQNEVEQFMGNPNPRCLLAIEIEFSGSSKLILGDFTNASMMGLVGVVIGPPNVPYMDRIREVAQYARTLRELEKAPPILFTNVAHMTSDDFIDLFH